MGQLNLDGFTTAKPFLRELQSQGQQAVRSGQAAEDTIYCIFKERGYAVERQYTIGNGIYGRKLHVDFFVAGIADFPDGLIIESKWQEVSGSKDEVFPYLVTNIRQCFPCPAIVVYGGGGARPGAIEWLRRQADGGKLYAVFSFEEFQIWVIRNL